VLTVTIREFLRGIAASDGRCLGDLVSRHYRGEDRGPPGLHPSVRVLVELAALLAADAPTATVRWAAERAAAAGASDEELVGVLLATGPAAGEAQTVSSAPRLALALDLNPEVEGWDGE
jgi:alkylhydroperoxidase/carboxymuconolactone decarboxylase family protein YurZ